MRSARRFRPVWVRLLIGAVGFVGVWGAESESVPEWRTRGIRLAVDAEYRAALEVFEARLGEDSSDTLALYYVGLCRFFLGDIEGAVGALEESVRSGAEFPEAFYWLAWVRRESGDLPQARWTVERGLERFSSSRKLLELQAALSAAGSAETGNGRSVIRHGEQP